MFVTAYDALIEDAKVGPGDVVLVPAASSSVWLAAIQLAALAGATPVALTRTSAEHRQLLDAGAKHVIANGGDRARGRRDAHHRRRGARVVFDPVGGPTFPKLVSALTFQGRIYLHGALSAEPMPLPVLDMIANMPTLKGHNIRETSGDAARREAAVASVRRGLASGALKPVIDRVFPFDKMVEAHRYLETNGQYGEIVVTVP